MEVPSAQWYSSDMIALIQWILNKDRHKRPTIAQVQTRVEHLLNPHKGDVEAPDISFFNNVRGNPFNERNKSY
jgi:hypothetical protein